MINPCVREEVFFIDELYKKSSDYVASPFRYPGGKFYALKFIIPFLNCIEHDEYREPFVGGGSVFFGKKKSKVNIINDLESDLIATYRAIASDEICEKLIEELSIEVVDRDRHKFYKELVPNSEYELAKKIYYLNRTSYSGIINKPAWGYKVGNSSPPENWHRFLSNANGKLKDVIIENTDFTDIIDLPPKNKGGTVLMYLDPPYYHADTKRAYTKPFTEFDHQRLAKKLMNTDKYFCLSYDDCSEIRDLYNWANIYERSWFYNTANTSGKRIVGNELIITNYNVVHK